MKANRFCIVLAIIVWAVFLLGARSCGSARAEPSRDLEAPIKVTAPLPDDAKSLKNERDDLKARLRLVEGKLTDTNNEAIQTKIWFGVGALILAGGVLIFLGVYTTRRFLISLGVGALGLAALGVLAVPLVPYIAWIGGAAAALVLGTALYMLRNRETGLVQVSKAVASAKTKIPAFRNGYKAIFSGHIDTGIDNLLTSVRKHHIPADTGPSGDSGQAG